MKKDNFMGGDNLSSRKQLKDERKKKEKLNENNHHCLGITITITIIIYLSIYNNRKIINEQIYET